MADARNIKPSIGMNGVLDLKIMTLFAFFRLFFPLDWFTSVLLGNVNKIINGEAVSIGEMFRWIGLWFYMATFKVFPREEFWSSKEIDDFDGAPVRFSCWMSYNRFNKILSALQYTDKDPPVYPDRFHQVRQMIQAWNDNMAANFRPGWISCLDESMSPWTSKWTCPGWMFVPRKPHPMGNEYHSFCCGLRGIMWGIELVEGKDAPPQRTDIFVF
jgi:Transposase IS4